MDKPLNRVYLLIFVLFLISACALPITKSVSPQATAELTNTPPKPPANDLFPFKSLGCQWLSETNAICPEDSIPHKMGCDTLSRPSELVNLLSPDSQFVNCSYTANNQPPNEEPEPRGLYKIGCISPGVQRLLTYHQGDYLLIRDLEELQTHFTPVNSAEKALGYVIVATGFNPIYHFDEMQDYRIFVDKLQSTSIQPVDDGFVINLFSKQICGCGPHTTFMEEVKVTFDGEIQKLNQTPVFEDPAEDGLCVD